MPQASDLRSVGDLVFVKHIHAWVLKAGMGTETRPDGRSQLQHSVKLDTNYINRAGITSLSRIS